MASNVRPMRHAHGGPKYRFVPAVFAALIIASAVFGWLLFQAVGS
jgi:hypothetical protein